MQRKGIIINQLAEDCARAACLETDDEVFSEGYISFNCESGVSKAMKVAESGLNNSKNYDIYLYFFCEPEYETVYSKYVNGVNVLKDARYEKGHNATEYIPELPKNYDKELEYPCVICVIDTGLVKFKLDFLSDVSIQKKAGMHEYLKG